MIVVPMKLKITKYSWDRVLTLNAVSGRIPAPTLKSGSRYVSMCGGAFRKFFTIPMTAKKVRMHFSKSRIANGELYLMESKVISRTSRFNGCNYRETKRTLDGFTMPVLMGSGNKAFDAMIASGHKYVSLSYKD